MPCHFFKSIAKLSDVEPSSRATARSDSITKPAQGEADQPFCGAEINTSTPVARMSTHAQPDAIQSSTNSAPTAWAAAANAEIYASGKITPAEVSTCGANTTSGLSAKIRATTVSIGGGENAACAPLSLCRALITWVSAVNPPASKIWLQR